MKKISAKTSILFQLGSGHTIMEVLVAMFIFIVMILMYAAASNSVVLNKDAKNKELALSILVDEMEELRATSFVNLPASGALSHPLLNLLPNSSLNLIMTDVDTNLKQAKVSIIWRDATNFNSRQMELNTYISSQGL